MKRIFNIEADSMLAYNPNINNFDFIRSIEFIDAAAYAGIEDVDFNSGVFVKILFHGSPDHDFVCYPLNSIQTYHNL